jgi:beta-lactamase regulating signal transducer with metallopeptidase domain
MTSLLALYAVRVLLMLSAGALADRCLRRRAAALRHLSWSLVLAGSLLLGPLSIVLPAYRIPLPMERIVAGKEIRSLHAPLPDGDAEIVPARRPDFLTVERAFLTLWLSGSLVLLARLAVGRLRLAGIRRHAVPVADPGTAAILAEAAVAVGCRRRVRLLRHGEMAAPVTFGVARPVILLPAAFPSWPELRLRAVLLHELSHVARLDALPHLLAELACALHWFDPLAWYAARRLARERERACDDRVLAAGLSAPGYAGEIVEVARESMLGKRPGAALAVAGCNELESRILGILDPATPRARTTRSQRLRLALAVTLLAAGLAGLSVVSAPAATAAPQGLDDPLSEIVPVRDLQAAWPSADEVRRSPDAHTIGRLMTAAAHVKTWEGDLVRERAEWALAQMREGEVVRPLILALDDPDWRVQDYAAWSLGVAGDRRAAEPIVRLLDHPVWRVRAQAIYALLDLGAGLDLDRLTRLATDPAWQVRIGVVEHLQRRGGAGAAALLRTMADDPHAGTRLTVRAALAAI